MKAFLLKGAAIAALVPSFAAAQPAGETGAPSGTPVASTEEVIVVTAQRRSESLQKVPVAVTAFSSENRDRLGIRTIQDMAGVTPGVSFSATLDRLSIRGVGRLTNIIGSDPGVAVYNDGFYTASNAEASKTPMFVDRVEILRGPQGTLYGRNSVGGSVNVISKRPTEDHEGELRLTADRIGGYIAEGYVSGPIVGDLKGRLSVQYGPRAIDHAFENIGPAGDTGAVKRHLVEAQIQYDFSEDAEIWFKYSTAEWNDSYGSANLVTPYATDQFLPTGALVPNPGFGYTTPNPGVLDPRTRNTNSIDNARLTDNQNFVVNFRAEFQDVKLSYVGGYSQYLYTQFTDLDLTAATTRTQAAALGLFTYNPTYQQRYIEDKKYYSNEVTLSNATPGSVNWMLGAYQYHEEFFQPIDWFQGGNGTDMMAQNMAVPVCVNSSYAPQASCAPNPLRSFYSGSSHLEVDSFAGFGQIDFEIATDLRITLGARYSSDEKAGDETYRLVNYNPLGGNICTIPGFGTFFFNGCGPFGRAVDLTRYVLQLPGSGPASRTLSGEWSGWSWRLAADYAIDADTTVYASYSRGIKSGGFNLGSFAVSPTVGLEKVDAYEIGLKSKPAKGLLLNLSAYYYDYRDAQIPISVPLAGPLALNTTNFFNIPELRSFGAELEMRWAPTDDFEIAATYSYLESTIERAPRLFDDPNAPGNFPVDIAGNRTPGSSRHKASVSALYDIPLGPEAGSLFLAASYIYRSNAYYDVFQSATGRAPGWDQVDARITYVSPSREFTAILYARNIFDTLGYDGAVGNGGTSAAGFGQIYSFTPPRQIGVALHVRF